MDSQIAEVAELKKATTAQQEADDDHLHTRLEAALTAQKKVILEQQHHLLETRVKEAENALHSRWTEEKSTLLLQEEELRRQVTELKEEKQSHQQSLRQLSEKHSGLQVSLMCFQRRHSNNAINFQNNISEMEAEAQGLHAEITKLSEDGKVAKSERQALKTQFDEAVAQVQRDHKVSIGCLCITPRSPRLLQATVDTLNGKIAQLEFAYLDEGADADTEDDAHMDVDTPLSLEETRKVSDVAAFSMFNFG